MPAPNLMPNSFTIFCTNPKYVREVEAAMQAVFHQLKDYEVGLVIKHDLPSGLFASADAIYYDQWEVNHGTD